MLPPQQQAEFETSGVVKVRSVFSEPEISRARNAILARFEALNLSRNGQWHLDQRPPANWPDKGYSAKQIGNKIAEVECLLDAPPVKQITDNVLAHSKLDTQIFKRPQILVTLPNRGAWHVPHDGWHVDIPRLSSGQRPGVQIFIILSEIQPQGGGTLVVSGSHRLLNNGEFIRSRDVTKRLRQYSFFRKLMATPHPAPDQYRHTESDTKSQADIPLDIVELTGAPGDLYLMDMRALHSAAPNASHRPRMMATHRFLRAETAVEIAANP